MRHGSSAWAYTAQVQKAREEEKARKEAEKAARLARGHLCRAAVAADKELRQLLRLEELGLWLVLGKHVDTELMEMCARPKGRRRCEESRRRHSLRGREDREAKAAVVRARRARARAVAICRSRCHSDKVAELGVY